METKTKLAQWLEERLRSEHLSLRQAAEKTGVSHATIADIIKGNSPSPETIRKLAQSFGNGTDERLALEDHLLTLAGYRTPRPEGEEPSEAYATLIDKVGKLSDSQVKMMSHFADFLMVIGDPVKVR